MKNKLFRTGLLLMASLTLGTALLPINMVFANELEQEFISNDNSMDLTSNVETFPLDIGNDEILNFFSEEDRDFYQQYLNSNNQIQSRSGVKTRERELSRKVFYNKFIGYNSLTPNWSYASSYTLARSKNVSFTTGYSYDGISANLSVSQTYGVTTTLPANSKKSSRLAAKADVTVAKCRVEAYYGNTVTKRFDVLRTRSYKNITNYVSYR